jgi:hypothetical protein
VPTSPSDALIPELLRESEELSMAVDIQPACLGLYCRKI